MSHGGTKSRLPLRRASAARTETSFAIFQTGNLSWPWLAECMVHGLRDVIHVLGQYDQIQTSSRRLFEVAGTQCELQQASRPCQRARP